MNPQTIAKHFVVRLIELRAAKRNRDLESFDRAIAIYAANPLTACLVPWVEQLRGRI